MRFNSTVRDNDKKKDNSIYFMYAVFFAIASFFILNIVFDIMVIVLKITLNYWWAVMVITLITIILKKSGAKK